MGVPGFFKWITIKYPKVLIDCIEERVVEMAGTRIPLKLTDPNPNGEEFDCLYVDMNGLVHPCLPLGLRRSNRLAGQTEKRGQICRHSQIVCRGRAKLGRHVSVAKGQKGKEGQGRFRDERTTCHVRSQPRGV